MRKVDPEAIRDSFVASIDGLLAFFDRAVSALSGTTHAKADATLLAEGVFLSASVLFETFVSDLFLAYVNRDATVLMAYQRNRANQMLQDKLGSWYAGQTRFPASKHVKAAEVRALLDARGYNLGFPTAASLRQRATEWLVPAYANRLQLSPADGLVFDTVKAIRDYLAHRSTSAHAAMNQALAGVTKQAGNGGLGRAVNDVTSVGAFLKTRARTSTRLALYLARIRDIATRL